MKAILAITFIVLFPLAASALDCRMVETDNKIEMICEGESPTPKAKSTFDPRKPGKDESENLEVMERLQADLDDLIRNNSKPESIKELLKNAQSISLATKNQCAEARLYTHEAHVKCLNFMEQINQRHVEIMLKSADFFAKTNMKSLAAETYQDVIKTFTGEAYESSVKQAETGLNDLKEK